MSLEAHKWTQEINQSQCYRVYLYLIIFKSKTIEKSYDFMDVMGDFGGCTEIIVIFFGIILNLISEFSFKLKALKKLYKVKSKST